jgi:hypothetical protein
MSVIFILFFVKTNIIKKSQISTYIFSYIFSFQKIFSYIFIILIFNLLKLLDTMVELGVAWLGYGPPQNN